MAEKLANNAASTLNGGINDITQTIVVSNGTVFPASSSFRIIIDSELILVGSRSGNTFSSCTRGVEGTSAVSHSNGAAVTHVLTTEGLRQYLEDALKDGTALGSAADTNLYRSAANILRTDDALSVGGNLYPDASVIWSSDTNLYRSAANTLKTDDTFRAAVYLSANDNTADQVTIGYTGAGTGAGMTFGSGFDTNLYRQASDRLATDDRFYAAGGLVTPSGSAAAGDGLFTNPTDGLFWGDSLNNRLWIRLGGVWKYAALT